MNAKAGSPPLPEIDVEEFRKVAPIHYNQGALGILGLAKKAAAWRPRT